MMLHGGTWRILLRFQIGYLQIKFSQSQSLCSSSNSSSSSSGDISWDAGEAGLSFASYLHQTSRVVLPDQITKRHKSKRHI